MLYMSLEALSDGKLWSEFKLLCTVCKMWMHTAWTVFTPGRGVITSVGGLKDLMTFTS